MSALTGATPTARRELGDCWRERIEHELDKPGDNGIAERIYMILATLPGHPDYQTAWQTVVNRCNLASDVRNQYYLRIFDMLWQTLCEPWDPSQAYRENEPTRKPWTLVPVAA